MLLQTLIRILTFLLSFGESLKLWVRCLRLWPLYTRGEKLAVEHGMVQRRRPWSEIDGGSTIRSEMLQSSRVMMTFSHSSCRWVPQRVGLHQTAREDQSVWFQVWKCFPDVCWSPQLLASGIWTWNRLQGEGGIRRRQQYTIGGMEPGW